VPNGFRRMFAHPSRQLRSQVNAEPGGDHLASRDYRRHRARVLTRRALNDAVVN
jgi:CO/xanthine dehydrogenase FAD-binding subunit